MKFAVIGCGSMGNRRIRHALDLKVGEVVGMDQRPDRRQEVERQFGILTVGTFEDLRRLAPDAIFVCVPPAEHMGYLEAAVEHGWHFMVEQPVSHMLGHLDELVKAVERRGLTTHVSCNMRFHQAVRKMKEWIDAETIGPIVAGMVEVGEWLPDWHPYEPYADYYPSRRAMGGGLDAICDLEWLSYLFGPVSRMACFAGKKSRLDIDTDDVIQILVEFEVGASVMVHSDMIQRSYTHKAKFIGEKGTVEWDWGQRQLRLYRAESKEWETVEEKIDLTQWPTMKMKPGWEWVEPMYLEDTRAFLRRLLAGDRSTDSLATGIENLHTTLQAFECSAGNRVWQNPMLRVTK